MANIVLVGFMGTGKTVVGRRVADALGLSFVDCDDRIAQRAGKPIPDIFAHDGEPRFRQLERQVIQELAACSGLVLATGGGVLGDPANRADLRRGGLVVALTATEEAIWQRVRADRSRPMLQAPDPRARLRELLARRAPLYAAAADLTVDTTGRTPEEVAAALREALTTVRVDLGERSYTVHIDTGLLARARVLLEAAGLAPTRLAVVTNPRVWELHGGRWPADLGLAVFAVPAGERNKSLRQASHLYSALIEAGADRRSALVAFGGGQVGDLAGFVAATYMRGLDFVQAPTTLLAQVDSSVGGKVAVNHPAAKNLVGAFHQPRLVIADLDTLATLPAAEFREGLAEIVKHAVIRDARMLEYLETHRTEIRERNPAALRHLVRRNVEIKAAVVSADEREAGLRAILNFGHTVGHALEILTRHRLRHGRAISIGMAVAAGVAERTGRLAPAEAERLVRLLRGFGLPTSPPALAPEETLRVMRADKKAIAGRLRLVLPTALGRVEVADDVPESLLLEVLGGGAGAPRRARGKQAPALPSRNDIGPRDIL